MLLTNITRHNLDYTGSSPNNKVSSENGMLSDKKYRSYTPTYAPYFKESVIVVDKQTNITLIKDVDYKCLDLCQTPSSISGKEVYSTILIVNQSVSNLISVTYQCVGGEYQNDYSSINNLINILLSDNRPSWWNSILNRPSEFNPTEHMHPLGDGYGFEYLVAALDKLSTVIMLGDEVGHDALRHYIDDQIKRTTDQTFGMFNKSINDLALDTASFKTYLNAIAADMTDFLTEAKALTATQTIAPAISDIGNAINASKAKAAQLYP